MMATGPVLPDTPLVLDTDILNDWRFEKQNVQEAIADYKSRMKGPPAFTSMTVFEALYGFEKRAAEPGGPDEQTKRGRAETEQLIQSCDVLSFDQTSATIAAYIFSRLHTKPKGERNKRMIDVFIAATAVAHGHGVATRNQKDFELIAQHLPPSHPLLRLAVWKP